MRYLTLAEVVDLHLWIAKAIGGASGIRDLGMLESAVAQPKATLTATTCMRRLQTKQLSCFSIVQGTHSSTATTLDMPQWLRFFF